MKDSTKKSKEAARQIGEILKSEPGLLDLLKIREAGKSAFDDLHKRLGVMIVGKSSTCPAAIQVSS